MSYKHIVGSCQITNSKLNTHQMMHRKGQTNITRIYREVICTVKVQCTMLRNLCMSNQREQSISHMKAVHAYDIIKANLTNNRNLYVWITLYLSS